MAMLTAAWVACGQHDSFACKAQPHQGLVPGVQALLRTTAGLQPCKHAPQGAHARTHRHAHTCAHTHIHTPLCARTQVRHLAGAELPSLQHLSLRRLGPALRWPDLQAAVLALPSLRELELHASGEFGAAAATALPQALARPLLQVDWRSTCMQPSLTLSHE